MALVKALAPRLNLGPDRNTWGGAGPTAGNILLDAANEAVHMIGDFATSDGGSHTIDTSGASKLEWKSNALTFANAATVLKVGMTTVISDGLARHVANVIDFDVVAQYTTATIVPAANTWMSTTPTSGSKTIAHGDQVAFCLQMTARGGADAVNVQFDNIGANHGYPALRSYLAASYGVPTGWVQCFVRFADGATGWINGGVAWSTVLSRVYNSGSTPDEYGELASWPYPVRVYGIWTNLALANSSADFEALLYTDPLGTPAVARSVAFDANVAPTISGRHFDFMFPTPLDIPANTPVVFAVRPTTANNVTLYGATLAASDHWDSWGLADGYGVQRTNQTGPFADANTELVHYRVGAVGGAFDDGVRRTMLINNMSVVG
jgi:hypothetical protein